MTWDALPVLNSHSYIGYGGLECNLVDIVYTNILQSTRLFTHIHHTYVHTLTMNFSDNIAFPASTDSSFSPRESLVSLPLPLDMGLEEFCGGEFDGVNGGGGILISEEIRLEIAPAITLEVVTWDM